MLFANPARWLVARYVSSDYALIPAAVGLAIALAGAFYALREIRCPQCGLKWVHWSVAHVNVRTWGLWLRTFGTCPKCAFEMRGGGKDGNVMGASARFADSDPAR